MKHLWVAVAGALAGPALGEVPITVAQSGHPVVPVSSSAFGPTQFVLDTGAQGTAVYATFGEQAGLAPSTATISLVGQTGAADLPVLRVPALLLDGVSADVDAVVLPDRPDGVPLAGIVGLDVFGRSLLDFDFPRRRAALHASGTSLDATRDVAPLAAARTAGDLLTVQIDLNGVTATAVLDTGARKTRINWALGRLLGLDAAQLETGEVIRGATGTPISTSIGAIGAVRLGTTSLLDAPVLIADLPVFEVFGVADRPAVILGLDWLEATRLIIDFPLLRVWFIAAGDAAGTEN